MRRILTAAALAAVTLMAGALLSGAATAAPAQVPQTPECGAALRDLIESTNELREAQAAFDALPERVPNGDLDDLEAALAAAKADLLVKLGATLEFDATDPGNVYSGLPGGVPPADAAGMSLDFLKTMLNDPDLGGGARAEVNAAIAAYGKVAAAEKALANGATIPNPDRTSGPVFERLQDAKAAADRDQDVADRACEGQQGDPGPPAPRPRVVPNTSSGVDTGDGSTV